MLVENLAIQDILSDDQSIESDSDTIRAIDFSTELEVGREKDGSH